MNIPSYTNIGGNYVMDAKLFNSLQEKGISNPFAVSSNKSEYGLEPMCVINKDDFAINHSQVIDGEGGLGSGEKLSKRFPNASDEELKKRRSSQIKNAQRKYRMDKREIYNDYMKELYKKMKSGSFISGEAGERFAKSVKDGSALPYSTPEGWYEERLKKARIANQKYRLKQKYENELKNAGKTALAKVEKEWKEKYGNKRGRPKKGEVKKVFSPDDVWVKQEYEKTLLKIQEDINRRVAIPYSKRIKKTAPDYPFGVYEKSPNGEIKLVTSLDDYTQEQRDSYLTNPTGFIRKKAEEKEKEKRKLKPKAPPVVSEKNVFTPTDTLENKVVSAFTPKASKKDLSEDEKNWEAFKKEKKGYEDKSYDVFLKTIKQGNPYKKWLESRK